MKLEGILSFPVTPFAANGEVDLDLFARHVQAQARTGASALFVACGTGEFTALSLREYDDVVRMAVKVVDGAIPVYAGIGGGPAIAREFRDAAVAAGVDGLLLLPPYLVSSTPAGLLAHVRWVVTGLPVPVVVYRRANAALSPATAVELLDLPEVIGLKDGMGDVDTMLRIVTAVRTSGHSRAEEFLFCNGLPTAELSAQAYTAIGVQSYSSAVLAFAPDIAMAFYDALRRGDTDGGRRLLAAFYLPFAELRDEVPGFAVALVKAGARLAGLPVGGVRPPLVDPSAEQEQRLTEIIEAGQLIAAELNGATSARQ